MFAYAKRDFTQDIMPSLSQESIQAIIFDKLDLENIPEDILEFRGDAFGFAASSGNLKVVNKLIELTPDESERYKMIHDDDDFSFQHSAAHGYLDIVNILVELTPNEEERYDMLIASLDYAFFYAAKDGHLETVNKLLELTQQGQTNSSRFSHLHISTPIKIQEFLAIVTNTTADNLPPLDPERITKLTELRNDLITNFSGQEEQSPKQETATINKANYVMARLLTNDNLKEAKDLLQNTDTLERRKDLRVIPDSVKSMILDYASIPNESLKFRSLEDPDAELAINTIKDFFEKPNTRILARRTEKAERLKSTEEDRDI